MKIVYYQGGDKSPLVYLKSETSAVRIGENLYYPLFCSQLVFEYACVVKIDKVARYVQREFASRYTNNMSVVANFHSLDLEKELKEKSLPTDLAYTFDNSFVHCNHYIDTDIVSGVKASCKVNGTEMIELEFDKFRDIANDAISYISTFIMLKKGDLVVITDKDNPLYIASRSDMLSVDINGEQILQTIIK